MITTPSTQKGTCRQKSAKAITDEGNKADVEFNLDVNFKVNEEAHEVKLKLYTTNCRIQFQHAGKKECKQYDHLKNQCPLKYFAQNIIFPFCKKAYEDLKENEEAFVSHLRDEINRLVKEG